MFPDYLSVSYDYGKNNSLIEFHKALLHWGSNVATFWSCDIDKFLYLQL